jgi:phage protein D
MIILKSITKEGKKAVDLMSTRIESLEYVDSDGGMDQFKLTLTNKDQKLFNTSTLLENTELIAQWGDKENLTTPRKIILTKISGFEKVTIEGHAKAIWTQDIEDKKRLFENKTYIEIVREVSREMGFPNPDIQLLPNLESETVQQYEPNSRFLARLARRVGFTFWIDVRNLHWRPRDASRKPVVNLIYKGTENSSEFGKIKGTPKFNFSYTRSRPAEIKAVSRKNKAEKKSRPKVNLPRLKVDTSSGRSKLVAADNSGDLVTKSSTEESERTYANKKKAPAVHKEKKYSPSGKKRGYGQWQKRSMEIMTGTLDIYGISSLLPGDVVIISNVGEIFEGKWYIKEIKHKQTSAFEQTLEVSRNSGKKVNKKGKNSKQSKKDDVKGKVNKATEKNQSTDYEYKLISGPGGDLLVRKKK